MSHCGLPLSIPAEQGLSLHRGEDPEPWLGTVTVSSGDPAGLEGDSRLLSPSRQDAWGSARGSHLQAAIQIVQRTPQKAFNKPQTLLPEAKQAANEFSRAHELPWDRAGSSARCWQW